MARSQQMATTANKKDQLARMQQDWWKSSHRRWASMVRHIWNIPSQHGGVRSFHAQTWIRWRFERAKIWISYRHNHRGRREQSPCPGRFRRFPILTSSRLCRRIWSGELDLEACTNEHCEEEKLFCSCCSAAKADLSNLRWLFPVLWWDNYPLTILLYLVTNTHIHWQETFLPFICICSVLFDLAKIVHLKHDRP